MRGMGCETTGIRNQAVERPERQAGGVQENRSGIKNQTFFLSGHCYHPTGISHRIFYPVSDVKKSGGDKKIL